MKLTLFLVGTEGFKKTMKAVRNNSCLLFIDEIYFLGKRYQFVVREDGRVTVIEDGKEYVAGFFQDAENLNKGYKMYVLVREFFASMTVEEPKFPEFNKQLEKYDLEYRETRHFVKTRERFAQHKVEEEKKQEKHQLNQYLKEVDEATEFALKNMTLYYAKLEEARQKFFGIG
jgi:hypothetical protein